MTDLPKEHRTISSWMVVFLLVLFVLIKGLFALFMIKNPGQPGWDYRPVKDIPGESPYAIYQKLPYSQHVKGHQGE
jgi:hypothetical protein